MIKNESKATGKRVGRAVPNVMVINKIFRTLAYLKWISNSSPPKRST
jgi:hypothetical protein